MAWGPDDWDAWTLAGTDEDSPPPVETDPAHELLRRLPGRERKTVADLGCGRGDRLPFLARHFGQVVALDYAPRALAAARRGCPDDSVIFRRRDLRDLSPFRGCFHVALALDSVLGPTVEDVDRMLLEIHRSLVDGGLFVGSFPARRAKGPPVAMALVGFPCESGPLAFSETDLQYRLRRAGFRGVRIRRLRGDLARGEVLFCVATRRGDN